jgi:hypothetical protein
MPSETGQRERNDERGKPLPPNYFSPRGGLSRRDDAAEREADRVAATIAAGGRAGPITCVAAGVARAEATWSQGSEQIANVLHDAMDRKVGTDEDAIFNALTGHSVIELRLIAAAYKRLSPAGFSLEHDLHDELSGDDLSRALALLRGVSESGETSGPPAPAPDVAALDRKASAFEAARRLWDAMRGPGTDEYTISAIAAGRSAQQWSDIETAFRALTGEDLMSELRGDLTDAEWAQLQKLLPDRAPKATAAAPDAAVDAKAKAEVIAEQIRTAVSGPGTYEVTLFAALTGRSDEELRAVADLFGGPEAFRRLLEDELTVSELAEIQPLLRPANPRARAHTLAQRLQEELDGISPSKQTVLSILGGRTEEERDRIDAEYLLLTKRLLRADLETNFGIDFKMPARLSLLEDPGIRSRWNEKLEEGLALLRSKFEEGEADPEKRGCWFPSEAEIERRKDRPPYDDKNWNIPLARSTPRAYINLDRPSTGDQPVEEQLDTFMSGVYTPKGTPHEGVKALLENLHLWECDCARYVEVAWLFAWFHTLSKEAFNERFAGLSFRKQATSGLSRVTSTLPAEPAEAEAAKEIFGKAWDEAPVGTKVVWKNESTFARPPWEDENAVKTRKGATPEEARYDAHPMGRNLTEEEVKLELARNSADFPDMVFKPTSAQVRALRQEGVDAALVAAVKALEGQEIEGREKFLTLLARHSEAAEKRLRQAAMAHAKDPKFRDPMLDKILERTGRAGTSDEQEKYIEDNIHRHEFSIPL